MAAHAARSLALSLVVHVVLAAIAVVLVRARPVPEVRPRASTRLAVELAPPAAPAVATPGAAAPVAVPVPAAPARPAPPARRVRAAAPAPASSPTSPAASGTLEIEPGAAPEPGASPSGPPVSAPVGASGAGPAGAGATVPGPPARPLDAESVRASVQRTLQYPRLARQRGLEGTVTLRFRVLAGGAIDSLTVVSSAGTALDAAAQDAVRRAVPFASGPGWVRIPVVFVLRGAP